LRCPVDTPVRALPVHRIQIVSSFVLRHAQTRNGLLTFARAARRKRPDRLRTDDMELVLIDRDLERRCGIVQGLDYSAAPFQVSVDEHELHVIGT
jgi:hypothetical protein